MSEAQAKEALRGQLRASGLRATGSRTAVLGVMRASKSPLTHADVVHALEGEGFDRATLYRNLMDLTEVGLLRRVALGPAFRFESKGEGAAHPHFVCTQCGGVSCAPEVQVPVQSRRGVPRSVRRGQVDVQLHGVCDDCE